MARTRTSLRLMLNTHRLARGKAQPFDGLVVEILVGQLKAVNRCGEAYTEAVALGRNLNALRGVASNGDVLAIVAHAELVALAAKGNAEQLEAKGNAKERNLREQGSNGRDGVDHKLGIPRSVRQQHPAWLTRQDGLGVGVVRNERHLEAGGIEHLEEREAHAKVENNELRTLGKLCRPRGAFCDKFDHAGVVRIPGVTEGHAHRCTHTDFRLKTHVLMLRGLSQGVDKAGHVRFGGAGNDGGHLRAMFTQVNHHRAGVDFCDSNNAMLHHVIGERAR